ncbi:MAG: 30S ribosome-binding factor RbfA [Thermoleophilia bacterium]|nr:30S ribosome-binding factor RbfA [Thermoleophilia bacterium]
MAIGSSLLTELADPRLRMVTVTGVESSPDLARAKVYWTVLNPKGVEGAVAALESSRGVLQGRVAGALRSRQTPHLVFIHDDLQDEARRLTALIDAVAPDGPIEEPHEQ